MFNNYDPIAAYYDFLSRLVFGQAEINAQVEMLRFVPAGSRVLVVGGGTGWILERLADLHPSGLHITYVESSGKMMARSETRNNRQNEVSFIHLPVERFVTDERYDCILTGFFFDNFSREPATAIFRLLDTMLLPGGHWLFADFYYHRGRGKFRHGLMLRLMYWSARLICHVEASEMTDMDPLFSAAGYGPMVTSFHYQGFIRSVAYRKTPATNDKISR